MSDYARANSGGATHFGDKDALTTGDADKVIVGSQFDTEFNAIVTAIASKFDTTDIASEAVAQAESSNTTLITPLRLSSWSIANDGVIGDLHALSGQAADALYGWDNSAAAAIGFTMGTGLAFNATTIEISHLGLEDLTDPNADRIFFWDDSAGLSTWLTVSNGLSINATTLGIDDSAAGAGLTASSGVLAVGAGSGLTVNANDVAITNVAAGAAQPVVITSGVFTFDLSSITELGIAGVSQSQDKIVVSDNGVIKVMPWDQLGVPVVEVANASQTFALTDANTFQVMTGILTADKTWTVPTNAAVAFDIGTCILVCDRDGTGSIVLDVVGDTGVTLTSRLRSASGASGSHDIMAGGSACLIKVATDEWIITGDIA